MRIHLPELFKRVGGREGKKKATGLHFIFKNGSSGPLKV
jgi:hypothetical protein